MREIFAGWDHDGFSAARKSVLLDFLFIPAYGLLLLALTTLLSRALPCGPGFWIAGAQVGAMALDVIENLFLLRMLDRRDAVRPAWPKAAALAARAKFALVFAALGYLLVGGAILLFR